MRFPLTHFLLASLFPLWAAAQAGCPCEVVGHSTCVVAEQMEGLLDPGVERPGEDNFALESRDSVEWLQRRTLAMGTQVQIDLAFESTPDSQFDSNWALAASEQAFLALEASEQRLSNWMGDSEISRCNGAQVGTAWKLSSRLYGELSAAVQLAEETTGAFSPVLGPLLLAWDMNGQGRVPTDSELSHALECSRLDRIQLVDGQILRSATSSLATGGFGKGAALNQMAQAMGEQGVFFAKVDLGGQWLLLGAPEDTFELSIAHPDQRDLALLACRVPKGSVATSGNSERAIEVGGQRFGHLLDPRSGKPAPNFGSVTVWSSDALRADAMSTALFVMGPTKGLAFAEAAPDLEAIFVERKGLGFEVSATTVFQNRVRLENQSAEYEVVLKWAQRVSPNQRVIKESSK